MEILSLDQAVLAKRPFAGPKLHRCYVLVEHGVGRWQTAAQETDRPIWRERGFIAAGRAFGDRVDLSIYVQRNLRADKLVGTHSFSMSGGPPSSSFETVPIFADGVMVAKLRFSRCLVGESILIKDDGGRRSLAVFNNSTRLICDACRNSRQCNDCWEKQRAAFKGAASWPTLPLDSLSWKERTSRWTNPRSYLQRQFRATVETGAGMIIASVSRIETQNLEDSPAAEQHAILPRLRRWRTRFPLRSQASNSPRGIGRLRVCVHSGDDIQEGRPAVTVLLAGVELGKTPTMPCGGHLNFPEDSSTFEVELLDIATDLAFFVSDEEGRNLVGSSVSSRAVVPLAHLMHRTFPKDCTTDMLSCRKPVGRAVELRLLLFPCPRREAKRPPWRYAAASAPDGGMKRSPWVGLASLRVDIEIELAVPWLSTYLQPPLSATLDTSAEPRLAPFGQILSPSQDVAAWHGLAFSIASSIKRIQALIHRPPMVAEVPILLCYVLFCMFAKLYHWPLLLIFVIGINGVTDALSSRSQPPQVWASEPQPAFAAGLRRSKSLAGVKETLDTTFQQVSRFDESLARVAVVLSKARNLYRWADVSASFLVHAVVVSWLLIACLVLFVVPTRLIGIVGGLLLYFRVFVGKVVVSGRKLVLLSSDSQPLLGQHEDSFTRNPVMKAVASFLRSLGVAEQMKRNQQRWEGLWTRLPDEDEWEHRQICDMQIAEMRELSSTIRSNSLLPV